MERRLVLLNEMTVAIWIHFGFVLVAVIIGAIVLLRRKGDAKHRFAGRVWIALMAVAAISSFWIDEINDGGFSPIHILSAWTLFALSAGVIAIRLKGRLTNAVRWHKGFLQSLYATGIMIAGGFTFLPHRLLGRLTFGETAPWINLVFIGLIACLGLWVFVTSFRKASLAPWRFRG